MAQAFPKRLSCEIRLAVELKKTEQSLDCLPTDCIHGPQPLAVMYSRLFTALTKSARKIRGQAPNESNNPIHHVVRSYKGEYHYQ